MKYYCEKCGNFYDTEKEAAECDAKHLKAEAETKKLAEEKSARYSEIKKSIEQANALMRKTAEEINGLVDKYNEDYKENVSVNLYSSYNYDKWAERYSYLFR